MNEIIETMLLNATGDNPLAWDESKAAIARLLNGAGTVKDANGTRVLRVVGNRGIAVWVSLDAEGQVSFETE
ncbi:MAG: hypothetical protein HZC41_17925 [Chloroflexi bacterium]|nr:hypothetical protein [Chloroflexota bacterium]